MKFTQERLRQMIKEELESVISEDSSLSSREISAVTMRTSPDYLDSFETALVAAIRSQMGDAGENADLSKITRNIAELQAKLKSEIAKAHSVQSAGRKFIEQLAAMAAKLQ